MKDLFNAINAAVKFDSFGDLCVKEENPLSIYRFFMENNFGKKLKTFYVPIRAAELFIANLTFDVARAFL